MPTPEQLDFRIQQRRRQALADRLPERLWLWQGVDAATGWGKISTVDGIEVTAPFTGNAATAINSPVLYLPDEPVGVIRLQEVAVDEIRIIPSREDLDDRVFYVDAYRQSTRTVYYFSGDTAPTFALDVPYRNASILKIQPFFIGTTIHFGALIQSTDTSVERFHVAQTNGISYEINLDNVADTIGAGTPGRFVDFQSLISYHPPYLQIAFDRSFIANNGANVDVGEGIGTFGNDVAVVLFNNGAIENSQISSLSQDFRKDEFSDPCIAGFNFASIYNIDSSMGYLFGQDADTKFLFAGTESDPATGTSDVYPVTNPTGFNGSGYDSKGTSGNTCLVSSGSGTPLHPYGGANSSVFIDFRQIGEGLLGQKAWWLVDDTTEDGDSVLYSFQNGNANVTREGLPPSGYNQNRSNGYFSGNSLYTSIPRRDSNLDQTLRALNLITGQYAANYTFKKTIFQPLDLATVNSTHGLSATSILQSGIVYSRSQVFATGKL